MHNQRVMLMSNNNILAATKERNAEDKQQEHETEETSQHQQALHDPGYKLTEEQLALYREVEPILRNDRYKGHHKDPNYWAWLKKEHRRLAEDEQQRRIEEENVFVWHKERHPEIDDLNEEQKLAAHRSAKLWSRWYSLNLSKPLAPQLPQFEQEKQHQIGVLNQEDSEAERRFWVRYYEISAQAESKGIHPKQVIRYLNGEITEEEMWKSATQPQKSGESKPKQSKTKLSKEQLNQIIQRRDEGISLRGISKMLAEQGVQISGESVRNILKKEVR
jgi:ribonucleotide reductase alpha subunit